MVDSRKRLYDACRLARNYPENLQRSKAFPHALEKYHNRLEETKEKLFDAKFTQIDLLESQDAGDEFLYTSCSTLDDLKARLQTDGREPICRYVFLAANHSRAPLDCSIDMFTYVMSFFQVMAPFLDLVFAFGRQYLREDFYYTRFRHEHYLNSPNAKLNEFAIPQLGRSGKEYQQCYNLWSVERPRVSGTPWSIRQTAFYHSFDVETGRALWVNVSPNFEIKSRIAQATSSHLSPGAETGKFELFAATLTTHLITFEWSVENWRAYISKLETDTRETLDTVNNIPVEDVEQVLAVDSGALLRPLLGRNNTSATACQPPAPKTVVAADVLSSTRKRTFSSLDLKSLPDKARSTTVHVTEDIEEEDPFKNLNSLSFTTLQRLNHTLTLLRTAALVMKLNKDILLGQIEYYEGLLIKDKYSELSDEFRAGCSVHTAEFCRRVRDLVSLLAMEQARVDTLVVLLTDGRDLFDKILQFRNIATGKLFALHGHQSAARMESLTIDTHQIAVAAKRETTSMHIITFVTLIFLPATFVATFLGSGLFQWDDDSNTTDPLPAWRPQFFALFAQISFPLTGGTVLVWLLASSWPRLAPWLPSIWGRRRRARHGDEEDLQRSEKEDN